MLPTAEEIEREIDNSISASSSAGRDGVSGPRFLSEKKKEAEIIAAKIAAGYSFSAYLEILKLKGRGKAPRVIAKPTIRDKVALRVLNRELKKGLASKVEFCLPNELVRAVVTQYHSMIDCGYYFLKTDIEKFYDSIPIAPLGKMLRSEPLHASLVDMAISSLRTPTVPAGLAGWSHPWPIVGIPQGLPISNTLSAYYLNGLDAEMNKRARYFRYVDDILIFCPKNDCDTLLSFMADWMRSRGLSINHEKTSMGSAGSGFSFLGYEFRGRDIKVREQSLQGFLKRIFKLLSCYYSWVQTEMWGGIHIPDRLQAWTVFINNLDEKITGAVSGNNRYGWLSYFSEINHTGQLHLVDSLVKRKMSSMPTDLMSLRCPKSAVKAYYKTKYNRSAGYVLDYNLFSSPVDRLRYLVDYGHVSAAAGASYTAKEIDSLFFSSKADHLKYLECDVGGIS